MTRNRSVQIRSAHQACEAEIALIAARMRLTLMEVLGEERGRDMYSMEWLCERVRFHFDATKCTGEVFVAEREGGIVGHAIVRLEESERGGTEGLFSTIYVVPEARRLRVADALVTRGEAWFSANGARRFGTNTSDTNEPLIALFAKREYTVTHREPASRMVHLSKDVLRG